MKWLARSRPGCNHTYVYPTAPRVPVPLDDVFVLAGGLPSVRYREQTPAHSLSLCLPRPATPA